MLSYVKENVETVLEEVETALQKAGRKEKPLLLAAVKYAQPGEIASLSEAGIAAFGENRVQQYLAHQSEFPAGVPIHFIGSLQKNKVKYIAKEIALIHSVSELSLAEEIEKQAAKVGRVIPVLLEVNSGRESDKTGVMPEDAPALFEKLLEQKHLAVKGLMTMGPRFEKEEDYRPLFAQTRELAFRLFEQAGLREKPLLSMGMSESYRAAIAEGADILRIGRRFFLGRPENENQ